MLANAGLFVLVWESITVLVGTTTKALNPTYALAELLVQAGLVLPLALYATYLIDRHLLTPKGPAVGRLPELPPAGQLLPSAEPVPVHRHSAPAPKKTMPSPAIPPACMYIWPPADMNRLISHGDRATGINLHAKGSLQAYLQ